MCAFLLYSSTASRGTMLESSISALLFHAGIIYFLLTILFCFSTSFCIPDLMCDVMCRWCDGWCDVMWRWCDGWYDVMWWVVAMWCGDVMWCNVMCDVIWVPDWQHGTWFQDIMARSIRRDLFNRTEHRTHHVDFLTLGSMCLLIFIISTLTFRSRSC